MVTVASIHQPQYLPYLGFFHKVAHSDVLVMLDNVQFHRRGLQHRNRIKTSQGWQWLTVPVSSGSREVLKDVLVSSTEAWQAKHSRALELNYSRAPFFSQLAPGLLGILGRPWRYLAELDVELTRWVMNALGLETRVVLASSLGVDGTRSDLLVDICRAVGASAYLSGPGGRQYMDLAAFQEADIDVRWQDFRYPSYQQLFPSAGYIPDLSIVDVLFCCGAETTATWSNGDGLR